MRTKSPENERSMERKVHGTKVPWNFRSPGTKVPGNEKSRERKFPIGTIRSWERKVLGTKSPDTGIPLSALTACASLYGGCGLCMVSRQQRQLSGHQWALAFTQLHVSVVWRHLCRKIRYLLFTIKYIFKTIFMATLHSRCGCYIFVLFLLFFLA